MNDRTRTRNENEEQPERSEDVAAGMLGVLQDRVDELEVALAQSQARVAELEAQPATAAPAGDADLRALASTYRSALRNGHPDAPKHLEALLAALGA